MPSHNQLDARVDAVNRANKEANKLYDQLVEVFEPLVGQKILKADGGLLAKVAKLLPEMPNEPELMIYRNNSAYTLAWCVKSCEQVKDECHCVYEETMVYVGNLEGLHLKDIMGKQEHREDYSVSEVLDKRRIYKDKKYEADLALSALYPFGEYDL